MQNFEINDNIRRAKIKQKDATFRWAAMSFVIGVAITQDLLATILISVIGSLIGYLLYGWEVRDLENKRTIGGKR